MALRAQPPPIPFKLGDAELQYFEHYRTTLGEELAMLPYGVPEFWRRTILRDAARDRFVLNAVIALSAMSRALKSRSISSGNTLPHKSDAYYLHYSLALKHHTMVLAGYRRLLAVESIATIAPRRVLVITLIITAFEHMQGNRSGVDALISKSILVLQDVIMRANDKGASSQVAAVLDDRGIEEAEFYLARQGAIAAFSSPIYPLTKSSVMLFRQQDTFSPPDNSESLETFHRIYQKFLTLNLIWFIRTLDAVESGLSMKTDADFQHEQKLWVSRLTAWLDATKTRLNAAQAFKDDNMSKFREWIALLITEMALKMAYAGNSNAFDLSRNTFATHHFVDEVMQQARQILTIKFPSPSFQRYVYERIAFMTINLSRECRDGRIRTEVLNLNRELLDAESSFEIKIALLGFLALAEVEDGYRDEHQRLPVNCYHDWTSASWNEEKSLLFVTLTARRSPKHIPHQSHLTIRPKDWGLPWDSL